MDEQVVIRPADGETYANGVVVGKIVAIGEVAAAVEQMLRPPKTDTALTLATTSRNFNREKLVEVRENLAETTASWKFEKDRADALVIDLKTMTDSYKFEKNRADRTVKELDSSRLKVEGYDVDRHTERDQADKNREWAERVEKELDASKAYTQQLRASIEKLEEDLVRERERADELGDANRTLSEKAANAQIARDEARDQLAEFKEKYAGYSQNFQQQINAALTKTQNLSSLVDVQRDRLTAIEKLVLDPDLIRILVAWRQNPDEPTELELIGANLVRSIRDKFGLPPVATGG